MTADKPVQGSPDKPERISAFGKSISAANKVRHQLLEPFEPVDDPAERRQLRLLAGIMLVLAALNLISSPPILLNVNLGGFWWQNPIFYLSLLSFAIFTGGYLLARSGTYLPVAIMAVVITWFISIASILLSPTEATLQLSIVYLVAVVILASMLFSWRPALLVAIAGAASTLLLAFFSPRLSVSMLMAPLTGYLTAVVLTFALLRHGRKLDADRRSDLRASEMRWRSLVENAPTGVIIIDEAFRIEYVNERLCRIVNRQSEDIIGADFRTMLDEPTVKMTTKYYLQRQKGLDAPYHYEINVVGEDGVLRWLEVSAAVVQDGAGRSRTIAQVLDATGRKQAEEALRQSEEKYRLLVENQVDFVVKVDTKGRFLFASPSFYELIGKTEAELLGSHFMPLVHEENQAETAAAMESLYEPPHTCYVELRSLTRHGWRWLAWADKAVMNVSGEVEAIIGVGRDITERKAAEAELESYRRQLEDLVAERTEKMRDSEIRYRSLFDSMQEAFIVTDAEGILTEVNQAAAKMFGCRSPEDLIGENAGTLFASADDADSAYRDLVSTGSIRNFDMEMKKQDGSGDHIPVLASAIMRRDREGNIQRIEGVLMDITQRTRAEEALREHDELLNSILESITDGIVVLDQDFRYTYYNRAMEKLSMRDRSELLQRGRAWEHFPHLVETGVDEMMKRAMSGETLHMDRIPFKLSDGREGFTSETFLPLKDSRGQIIGIVGIIRDVTEFQRQEDEWRGVNQRLMELDRLRSKFISDVSHELRTPITSLRLYIDLLTRGAPEKRERYLSVIKDQGERLRNLLDGILDFSSLDSVRGDLVFSPVDLHRLVTQLVRDYGPRARTKGLNLTLRADEGIPLIHGDEAQLAQMVNNLLVNAISFTQTGGIYVTMGVNDGGTEVFLQVEDSGIGLDAEELEYCFNPFYRGKRVGQYNLASGPGMGLAVVNEIVKLHSGRIDLTSQVDQGSCFTVWLPIEEATVLETPGPAEGQGVAD